MPLYLTAKFSPRVVHLKWKLTSLRLVCSGDGTDQGQPCGDLAVHLSSVKLPRDESVGHTCLPAVDRVAMW